MYYNVTRKLNTLITLSAILRIVLINMLLGLTNSQRKQTAA